jgi:hypothetical protein
MIINVPEYVWRYGIHEKPAATRGQVVVRGIKQCSIDNPGAFIFVTKNVARFNKIDGWKFDFRPA